MPVKNLLLLLMFFLSTGIFAQNETNFWYFGTGSGLNFTTLPPVPAPGSPMSTSEGSSAVSDPVTGALLFYSDGITVWDASHSVMPNGTGLMGNSSSTQSCLIVPQPGSTTIFYVFTTDAMENAGALGCRYSIVDMTLNGGMGDVTSKNVLLFAPGSEQLCATKHANCTDWWVMTKQQDNNEYNAYLLTATGLTGPVTSVIGMSGTSAGQSKFSPDGTKYALSIANVSHTQLFDFDNTTGLLSNVVNLLNAPGATQNGFGISFSGDNTKLYCFKGPGADQLYQYDVSSGVAATIVASETFIASMPYYGCMQLAKDFKIYISHTGGGTVSVINNPNLAGAACGLSISSVAVGGYTSIGVCNFPDSYFNQVNPCGGLNIGIATTNVSCNGEADGSAEVVVTGNQGPYTVTWTPGGATTETISGLGAGSYVVTVQDSAGNIMTDTITITEPPVLTVGVAITGNDTLCGTGTITFSTSTNGGTMPYGYQWSTSASDTLANVSVTLSNTTDVIVTVTDANNCSASDTFKVTVIPQLQILDNDTCICSGTEMQINASGGLPMVWSTGETGNSIDVSPLTNTVYSVSYQDGFCGYTDSIHICVYPSPVISVSNDTLIDLGATAQLEASGNGVFYWSPSTGLSCVNCASPLASPMTSTIYTVTLTDLNGCTATANVLVEVQNTFIIPNIITPNGDGINDFFAIERLPANSALNIFNRWGNAVFNSGNYDGKWQGTSDGVYYYVLETPDGKTFSGFVHVTGN